VTDFSNASPTGVFDPFLMGWADWALKLFSIPVSILPKIVPTCGPHFGSCKIFPGNDIPILCVIADQSSSMFGSTSFHSGNVKVTLGTGAFLDVNTGRKPHASVAGIYPLVAWKYDSELVYMAEGCSKDNGIIVDWGKTIGKSILMKLIGR
jgi:putative glycerol kinase 5